MDSTIKRRLIISLIATLTLMLCLLFSVNATASNAEIMPVVSKESYSTFEMESGAQTRTDDKKAIRFITKISQEQLDTLTETHQVKVVTMITPARYLERKGINNDSGFVKGADVAMEEVVFSEGNKNLKANAKADGNYYFYACLFGVQDKNVTQDFAARSYLVIDGVTVAHTDYESEDNRSIYEVANALKEEFLSDPEVYSNLNALSSGKFAESYTVAVKGLDGKTANITATYGQPLYSFENEIASALNIDGVCYYDGTASKDGDTEFSVSTAIVESGLTVNAGMETITFDADGDNLTVTGVTDGFYNKSKIVKIPATFDGKTVKSVSANAFTSNVTEIHIPETVSLSANAISGVSPKIVKGDLTFTYKEDASKIDYLSYKFDVGGNVVFVDEQLDIQYALDKNYIAIPTPDDIKDGSEWREKYGKYVSDTTALTTPELWWKAVDAVKSTIPANEREKVYYVKALNNKELTEVRIPATFDDGVNGELPVKYIGKAGLGYNTTIQKVFATETLTELRGTAFSGDSNLQLAVLPGVKYLADIMYSDGSVWTRENFNGCASLAKLVVAGGFKASGINFRGDTGGVIRFYIYDENVISSTNLWIGSSYGLNALAMEDFFAYKAVCSDRYWQFDKNGEPQRNSNEHTYVDGKCEVCGAHEMKTVAYAYDANYLPMPNYTEINEGSAWRNKYEKYVPEGTDKSTLTTPELWWKAINSVKSSILDEDKVECYYVTGLVDTSLTEVTIEATFNDGVNGELPVIYIGRSAFASNTTIKKLFARSITELRGHCLSSSSVEIAVFTSLKYIANMDDTTSAVNYTSNNFSYCGKLKMLVVGAGFQASGRQFRHVTSPSEISYYTALCVYSDTTDGVNTNVTNTTVNFLLSGTQFKYDSTGTKDDTGYWHFDENGVPVHNKHVDKKPTNNVDGICDTCKHAIG